MKSLSVCFALPILVLALLVAPTVAGDPPTTHPSIFITQGQIDAIRAKIRAGQEPWTSAYKKLIHKADRDLKAKPWTVMSGPNVPYNAPHKDNHYYYHELQGKRTDYLNAVRMKDAARDLALAYAFSGEKKYADKARQILRVWFLDEATRMLPSWAPWPAGGSMQAKYQNDIELAITMAGAIYAMDLLWDQMTPEEQKSYLDWCREFGKSTYYASANRKAWTVQCMMACHLFAGDLDRFKGDVGIWKSFIGDQIFEDGTIKEDRDREQGLRYSVYCIQALCSGAEIARNQGVDLFGYKHPNGRSLELALDTHAYYFKNQSKWPYKNRDLNKGNPYPIYELAYGVYHKPAYLDVANGMRRPVYDTRTMGPLTLTHGNLFDLEYASFFVEIASPRNGRWFKTGADIPVRLAVTGEADNVATVDLYNGQKRLQRFAKPPYEYTIRSAPAGEYALRAVATDREGATRQARATIRVSDRLPFVHIEAESHAEAQGTAVKDGAVVGCDNNDYIVYKAVDFGDGCNQLTARLGCPDWAAGQKVEIRLDSKDGPLIGTLVTKATGGFGAYKEQSTAITDTKGTHDMVIVFVGKNGIGNFDWFRLARATP